MLTGRTPDRECIFSAEGCGQEPAWSCADKLPLPPTVFTVAEAAKAKGYATIHVGKWHLGDFFPKSEDVRKLVDDSKRAWVSVNLSESKNSGYAYKKWPVSHPGIHGFDEWHSTEASASSTTCNCACEPAWLKGGCIHGGGAWGPTPPGACTNYWNPTDNANDTHLPTRPECHNTTTSTLDCVHNLTTKIGASRVAPDTGDDTEHILNVFEDFLQRKTQSGSPEQAPFLAALWLHTNHLPHPALPQYYYAYNDTYGNPAGDYLGTLTQMDAQIGRLRHMLREYGVADNTLLWYTADNGPHEGVIDVRASTNGLRQCKASLFEGGILVPGMIEWPAMIRKRRVTDAPAGVYDIMPTILDILKMAHPNPSWAADGVSLLPRILDPSTDNQPRSSTAPLCFSLGQQLACVDNDWKIVENPAKGQCDWNDNGKKPPYGDKGPYLFNLKSDPTESMPLNSEEPELFQKYSAYMKAWKVGVEASQQTESTCEPPSPLPSPTPEPAPTPAHPVQTFQLRRQHHGQHHDDTVTCLRGGASITKHTDVSIGACDDSSIWQVESTSALKNVGYTSGNVKARKDGMPGHNPCVDGNEVFFGEEDATDYFVVPTSTSFDGLVRHSSCPGMCLSAANYTVVLSNCTSAGSIGWIKVLQ